MITFTHTLPSFPPSLLSFVPSLLPFFPAFSHSPSFFPSCPFVPPSPSFPSFLHWSKNPRSTHSLLHFPPSFLPFSPPSLSYSFMVFILFTFIFLLFPSLWLPFFVLFHRNSRYFISFEVRVGVGCRGLAPTLPQTRPSLPCLAPAGCGGRLDLPLAHTRPPL